MADGRSRTHAMRALVELRKRILAGELAGGTRLFEVPLAEALQISRTPVREAMARLADEGLLDRARGGGFAVRTFGLADVVDAIELRGVIEGTAARLAAERGVDPAALERIAGVVARLDHCFAEMPDCLDFEGYSELNVEFHHQLAGLAGSEVIRREVERVTRLPFASPSAFLLDRADIAVFQRTMETAQQQHRELVAAIAAREGTRAEALAREHARTARRNLDYVLEEDRSLIGHLPGLALVLD